MRIAILCFPTHGGSGVIASELAISLAEAGDEVEVFSHAIPPRLEACEAAKDPSGVVVHAIRGAPYPLFEREPHELAIASRLLVEHAHEPFDLIHAHYALPHAVVACLVRQAAAKPAPRVITSLHGTDTSLVGAAPEYAPLVRHALMTSDAITAVSQDLARKALVVFDLPRARAPKLIPNFVDTERFKPLPFAPKGPVRVLHVSNFRPLKQVPWLIEAFGQAAQGLQAELLLVGDGPDRAEAEARAQGLGMGPRVRFLGETLHVDKLHASADVFVLASEQESFGLSALEAMASGVPVLAPAVGGLPELLRDGVEGRLTAPGDRAAWVTALRGLLTDEPLRQALAGAARDRAVAQFARARVVDRYRELYRAVLES